MKAKDIFDKIAAIVESNVEILREYTRLADRPKFRGSIYGFREQMRAVLKRQCEKMGGEYAGAGVFSQAFAFNTEDEGAVIIKFSVKQPLQLPDDATLEKYRILKSRYLTPLARTPHVVMQPRAECPLPGDADSCERTRKAAHWLREWLRKVHKETFDCHSGNIGFLKGRVVFFDPLVDNL